MFKVMTLNLNYHGDKHGAWPQRRERILNVINRTAPDVLALQAVERDPQREGGLDQAAQLAERLVGYDHVVFQEAMRKDGDVQQGSAFVSRWPLGRVECLRLSSMPGTEDADHRVLLQASFESDAGSLTLFNAHFSWVYPQALQNLAESLPVINAAPGQVLLVGDLNTPSDKDLIARFSHPNGRWSDLWATFYPTEPGPTFESDAPTIRIDYALASPSLGKTAVAIERVGDEVRSRLSDHLGLVVSLGLFV